jgi:membrane-associated phospholipid phosphatase
MKYILLFCSFLIFGFAKSQAQEKTYSLDLNKDLIYSGVGLGMNIIGYSIHTEGATIEGINALKESDLWAIDRPAIFNNSKTARTLSDVILYSSMSIPFIIYSDKKCRSEGLTIGVMGLETFLITNGITTITKSLTERYRPFTYNPDIPLDEKLGAGARLSYFSGHTSVTTALSFFATKVLTDLRPDAKNKWIVWTAGASVPAILGYLRFKAGKHFLTDVISGYVVGAAVGYLVPAAHLNKNINVGIGFAGTLDFRLTF